MTPSFTWTEELKAELLACETDEELVDAFPEHKLESLKRRYREFSGGGLKSGGTRLGKLAELLTKSGIAIEEISKIDRVTVREWQSMHKDDAGNAVITDLEGASIVLTPEWATGPQWEIVHNVAPAVIHPRSAQRVESKTKTGIILSDMQVGYAHDRENDTFIPFHDERVMDLSLQIMADLSQVDGVWDVGDGLDLAEFGRFIQQPTMAKMTNIALQDRHNYLAEVSGQCPYATKRTLEGNHDRRIETYILKNAMKAFGVTQARLEGTPGGLPVFSVPSLLQLEAIGWDYLPGYPANIDWINERFAVVHGDKVRSGGSTAAAVVDDERVSVVFGHIHRIEKTHKTRRTYTGYKSNFAASIGCMCHIDGRVPSMKGGSDMYGRPIQRAENWQNGFAVVTYEEGDGPFDLEQVSVHEGEAFFRGNRYKSSV